jgi:hypothetical protein
MVMVIVTFLLASASFEVRTFARVWGSGNAGRAVYTIESTLAIWCSSWAKT